MPELAVQPTFTRILNCLNLDIFAYSETIPRELAFGPNMEVMENIEEDLMAKEPPRNGKPKRSYKFLNTRNTVDR